MQPQHVPAWKRLGLKLKYANEEDPASAPTNRRDVADHALASEINDGLQHPAKKRRTEPSSTPTPKNNGVNSTVLNPSLKRPNINGLKKKVSFSAETKKLDGDSSKSLIAAWEAENPASEELMFAQSQANNITEPLEPSRKVKGKRETGSQNSDGRPPGKSRNALDYLTQFHQDRQTWKFNKNREIWILKHVLSIDDIPASYDSALAEYVQGMQSKASKSRLADQCSGVLAEDVGRAPEVATKEAKGQEEEPEVDRAHYDMDDPERRKAYHDAAKERFKRKFAERLAEEDAAADNIELQAYQKRIQRRKRAILLFEQVSQVEETRDTPNLTKGKVHPDRATLGKSVVSTASAKANINGVKQQDTNGTEKPKMAKRSKRRTMAVIDTSSSSSEDESDSSEDKSNGRNSRASTSPEGRPTSFSNDNDLTSGSESPSVENSDDNNSTNGESHRTLIFSTTDGIPTPTSASRSMSRSTASSRRTRTTSGEGTLGGEDSDSPSDEDSSEGSSSSSDSE